MGYRRQAKQEVLSLVELWKAESLKNCNTLLKREIWYIYFSSYHAEVYLDVQHLHSLSRTNLNLVMMQNVL